MTRRGHLPSARELPKAYLRLDPDIDQKHPDNGWEYIRLLCASNRQRPRGIFTGRATLEAIFGKAAVKRFYDRADVFDREDGRAETAGWDAWQEGDLTVAERVRRTRSNTVPRVTHALPARDNVTHDDTPDALPARYSDGDSALPVRGTTSLSLSTTLTSSDSQKTLGRETRFAARTEDDDDPAFPLRQWLAAHSASVRDGDGYHRKLCQLVATDSGKTCDDVIAAFEQLRASGARTSKQFVMGAEDALFPTIKVGATKAPTVPAGKYAAMVEEGDDPPARPMRGGAALDGEMAKLRGDA
jgi:hypothetical protein